MPMQMDFTTLKISEKYRLAVMGGGRSPDPFVNQCEKKRAKTAMN
tara:strand:+ start:557 stop:691 length:135 start_codon:yes stop_codon:yes gene_type:complete